MVLNFKGYIMNEAFKKFLEDEFPPVNVFCMFNGEVRSLVLKKLSQYPYSVVGIDPQFKLPILKLNS